MQAGGEPSISQRRAKKKIQQNPPKSPQRATKRSYVDNGRGQDTETGRNLHLNPESCWKHEGQERCGCIEGYFAYCFSASRTKWVFLKARVCKYTCKQYSLHHRDPDKVAIIQPSPSSYLTYSTTTLNPKPCTLNPKPLNPKPNHQSISEAAAVCP